jgi:ribonucleotide monophosphatase NagD (HAD superfamily)
MAQIDYTNLEKAFDMDPMVNNQKIKKGRGGPRPGSGRKKGAIQKLGGADLLDAIAKVTGKPFAENIAEHYHRAILANDWSDVRDYEKFIVAKVISDTKEVDITSNGETLGANFNFPTHELTEWKNA